MYFYQHCIQMRLRDASGDALCVVESNVLALIRSRRDTGGDNMLQPPQPQWEVQEVRHRLVNTTSTLYLDSSTGQLVRLQQQQHSSTSTTSSSSSASFSLLLSRIDDGVHSSLLGAIALCSNNSSGKVGSAHLPAFRIEAICDANPAAIEALRPAHPYQSK